MKKAIAEPKLARRIKNRIILDIRKSLLPSGNNVPDLKDSTIRARERLAKYNKTDSRWFSPHQSNLTFTGKFLRSFEAIIKLVGGKVIFDMGPNDKTRRPYKTSSERRKKKKNQKSLTNAQLGQHLIDGGRDYTDISEENQQKIAKSVKAAILKEFKLNLKRK